MTRQTYVEFPIRRACAAETGIPNELLTFTDYDAVSGHVSFCAGDTNWTARLNKSGKAIRKGSVRRDRN
jgi:hypothetical protein